MILLITLCAFGNFLFNGLELYQHTCSTEKKSEISFKKEKCDHSETEFTKKEVSHSCCIRPNTPIPRSNCCESEAKNIGTIRKSSSGNIQKLCCKIELYNVYPGLNFNDSNEYTQIAKSSLSPFYSISKFRRNLIELEKEDFSFKERRHKKRNTKTYIFIESYLL